MASQEESFDSIFGAEAAEEDTDTTVAGEGEDDSNGSEADQTTEEDDSDEDEQSSRALAGLKKEASTQRKRAQEAEEKAKAFERLAKDPRFIADQARRLGLQVSKADGTPQPDQQGIDPEAPFYERSPEGRADKRLDMREAVSILPDLPTDDDLADEVMYLASKGRSIVEAAETVRERYEKAGKATDAKENAKLSDSDRRKQRLSTSFAPGKGAPSKQAQLLKSVKSGSETERLMAGAELLGF